MLITKCNLQLNTVKRLTMKFLKTKNMFTKNDLLFCLIIQQSFFKKIYDQYKEMQSQ